ncbi:MAG: hypothetical protein U1D55_14705 [Phycisphaerae bacterium]
MSTRRTRPVLYEVLRRSPSPRGAAPRRPVAAPPSADLSSQSESPQREIPENSGARIQAPASLLDRIRDSGVLPQVEFHDGRLILAAAWPALALMGVVLLVLLWIAFATGGALSGGRRAAPDDLAVMNFDAARATNSPSNDSNQKSQSKAATNQPPPAVPTPRVAVAPRVPDAAPPAKETEALHPAPAGEDKKDEPATVQLEKGRTYLVIQHFKKGEQKAADAAAAFLQANGVPCGLVPPGIRLVATEGFALDTRDPAARKRDQQRLDQLRTKVLNLGKEFGKSNGYNFDRCYPQPF